MSIELRPCPFCGSTDIYHEHNEITGCYELGCNQCGAWPYQEGRKDDVVRKWNRRVERMSRNVGPEGKDIFICSGCGAVTFRSVGMPGEPSGRLLDVHIGYCPNCGAKVAQEDDEG